MTKLIKPIKKLSSEINIPGDKSISHRSIMFSSIAKGDTKITGFLTGEDCFATIDCFRAMGIDIKVNNTEVYVKGKGLEGLRKSEKTLYVGNSGTTFRLLSGLLSWQKFTTTITGDSSIQKRPMNRIIKPLREMGADITAFKEDSFAPLTIEGNSLKGVTYNMPMASAQVKSCIILASLKAEGETIINEPAKTRDHSEILLNYLGADIETINNTVKVKKISELLAKDIFVPGDISSAAFFIVAALIIPESEVMLRNININPTRTGIITALKSMGGNISFENERNISGEPVADIIVKYSKLKATKISGEIIPRMIDEIPIFAVASIFAEGKTIIADAEELKVKESNRINAMVTELSKMGANISETTDGMIITGTGELKGAEVFSYDDHRVAMSLAIAGICAKGETSIESPDCVDVSFPGFFELLK